MKRKFENRIKKLEQIVDPEPYFNLPIIFDPNKPMPTRPPNVPEGQVLIYLPHNGRDEIPDYMNYG
jgi:hypothetical protein